MFGIPREISDSDTLLEHFQEIYGKERVVFAHIIPDLSVASKLMQTKVDLTCKLKGYEVETWMVFQYKFNVLMSTGRQKANGVDIQRRKIR